MFETNYRKSFTLLGLNRESMMMNNYKKNLCCLSRSERFRMKMIVILRKMEQEYANVEQDKKLMIKPFFFWMYLE